MAVDVQFLYLSLALQIRSLQSSLGALRLSINVHGHIIGTTPFKFQRDAYDADDNITTLFAKFTESYSSLDLLLLDQWRCHPEARTTSCIAFISIFHAEVLYSMNIMVSQQIGTAAQQERQPVDIMPREEYQSAALAHFRISHENVEQQGHQLEEQHQISLVEGSSGPKAIYHRDGGNNIDDFSIKLEKQINRWAVEIVREPPAPVDDICAAVLKDIGNDLNVDQVEATPMQLQYYLRHAFSETISDGIINCLLVTDSKEANVPLKRTHDHLLARDTAVAATLESSTPDLFLSILYEQMPEAMKVLGRKLPMSGGIPILDSAYALSRMLHGACSTGNDTFYRAFVPKLGSALITGQIELVIRCLRGERGEVDRVGAALCPGLMKVSRGSSALPNGQGGAETRVGGFGF